MFEPGKVHGLLVATVTEGYKSKIMPETTPDHLTTPEPGIRCLLAPNASPMTYWGTNTYILGEGKVAVIDPGPADIGHLRAILDALEPQETISHIFVTHSHVDHSPLALHLSDATGAAIHAFGTASAGRSVVMTGLVENGLTGGGEGIDHEFNPDVILKDGDKTTGENWELDAIWTPGHIGNHLCFAWGDRIFTGDHIMGWASSLVSPPDGDLTDFMASLHKLAGHPARVYYPGHGAPVTDPTTRREWLILHRVERELSIVCALSNGPKTVAEIARMIYTDVNPALLPAAERNVLAHLIDLVQDRRAVPLGTLSDQAQFALS